MVFKEHAASTVQPGRLLQRFLRYVRVDTAADPHSTEYPSSPSQRSLGATLVEDLQAIGITNAHQDENALVWATIPANHDGDSPAIALVAHVDTSPEAPSQRVQPQVVDSYAGGPIELKSGAVIDPASSPTLNALRGKTLITTDGTTLLGGDDKAGVAIIMEVANILAEAPHLPHGPVHVLFTCDEEIGRGTDKIDLKKLSADVAYTLDGGGAGVIDVETFSADAVTAKFVGHNIHPAIAKDRMVNAVRASADFVTRLSDERSPERTSGRDGFIHPHSITGGVGEVIVEMILRSFESDQLDEYFREVQAITDQVVANFSGLKIELSRRRQYRNLREGLARHPDAVAIALKAYEQLGLKPQKAIVRGGTDGSQLTEKGLPTPNLSSGQHNIHAVTEFACLDEMVLAAEHVIRMLALWSEKRR